MKELFEESVGRSLAKRISRSQIGLPLLILAMAVITGVIEPRFWSAQNLANLSQQLSPLMILVSGQVIAVISGGLDLSVASVMALSGVVGVLAGRATHNVALSIGTMLLVGLGVGLVNGVAIAALDISPLIMTLGMLSVAKGVALLLTGGLPLYDVPQWMVNAIGYGTILGVPVSAIIAVATLLIGFVLLRYSLFGRYVYAIGSSPAAAISSGVNVKLYVALVYVICGGMAGVAAIVFTSWVSGAQPLAGTGMELQSLAAVVVGGVALTGGTGTMLQAFYGAVILGMLSNTLNMAGVSSFFQTLVVGLVIVAAVILDRIRRIGDT